MKKYNSPEINVTVFSTVEYICASSDETPSKSNIIELPEDEW